MLDLHRMDMSTLNLFTMQCTQYFGRKVHIGKNETIELIDLDHDAGDYVNDGGDYIKLLDWLEETGRNYPIRLHSMNPVGVANI